MKHTKTDTACIHYKEAGPFRRYLNERGRGKSCPVCVPAVDRTISRALSTTHIVRVACTVCDHLSYQEVKLGEEVTHDCTSFPVSMTILAWENEVAK